MPIISSSSHPTLFASLIAIMYDNGAINRKNPEPTELEVFGDPDVVELALKSLTTEEIETFCDGDEQDVEDIIGGFENPRREMLKATHKMFDDFFNNGMR